MERNHKIAIIGGAIVVTVLGFAILANKGILGNKIKSTVSKVPVLSELKTPNPTTIVKGSNNTTPNESPQEQKVVSGTSSFLLTKNNEDVIAVSDSSKLSNVNVVIPDLTGGYGASLIQVQ